MYDEWPTMAFLDIKTTFDGSVGRNLIWNHPQQHLSYRLFDKANIKSCCIHSKRVELQSSIMIPLLYAYARAY